MGRILERAKAKRRSISSLAQRYLAAIDPNGDAVELLLPNHSSSQSPGGADLSQTTRSTKQTARTTAAESSETSWHDETTPTPPPQRRKRQLLLPTTTRQQQRQQQQQQQQPMYNHHRPLDVSEDLTTPGSLRQREAAEMVYIPPTKLRVTTTRNNGSEGNVRESDADAAAGNLAQQQQQHAFPGETERVAVLVASDQQAQQAVLYHSDEDSSLTSRRTSESALSPKVHDDWRQRHHHQPEYEQQKKHSQKQSPAKTSTVARVVQYHQGHPLRDHLADDATNSVSSYDESSLPSRMIPFSMEKTFDDAVEKGLDMILSTNTWACPATRNDAAFAAQPAAWSLFPRDQMTRRKERALQHQHSSTTANMAMRYSPQRGVNNHNKKNNAPHSGMNNTNTVLRHSLSSETPRSDVTGASTQIATNRAVDLAMARIRAMKSRVQETRELLLEQQQRKRTTTNTREGLLLEASSSDLLIARQRIAARSLLSVSSNESSSIRIDGQRPADGNKTGNQRGRLGNHVQQAMIRSVSDRYGACDEDSSLFSKSLSSSVGVEIGNSSSRPRNGINSTIVRFGVGAGGARKAGNHPQSSIASVSEGDEMGMTAADLSTSGVMHEDSQEEDEHSSGLFLPFLEENSKTKKNAATEHGPNETRLFRVNTPATASFNSRLLSDSPFDGLDSCMSPPHIVRKSQSFEECGSPDPVFCSKSLSLSLHSSSILSHRSSSPISSVDASFESDNAMFMDKPEESCSSRTSNSLPPEKAIIRTGNRFRSFDSSLVLNLQPPAEAIKTRNRLLSIDSCSRIASPSNKAKYNAVVSLNAEPTLARQSGLEGFGIGKEREVSSPFSEVLGIRGSFPQNILPVDRSTKQQKSRSPTRSDPNESFQSKKFDESVRSQSFDRRLVPLVPLGSASPPPSTSPPATIIISDDAERRSPAWGGRSRRDGVRRKDSSSVVDAFLDAISRPEAARPSRKPDQGSGADRTADGNTSFGQSLNSSLTTKLSIATDLSRNLEMDQESVDVQSIRSALESILSPDDDDDDTASVKSLRERFEPINAVRTENAFVNAGSCAVADNFLTVISKPEAARSNKKPVHECGAATTNGKSSIKQSRHSSLASKMSRATDLARNLGMAQKSADVQSIRSAFSILSHNGTDGDGDGDTASVKSLRELFEPVTAAQAENGFTNKSSSTVADKFQSVLSHPEAALPTRSVGQGRNRSLALKMSRATDLSRDVDMDQKSVDVKSILSALESILSPNGADEDDNDDDTASVKSLRERFEPVKAMQGESVFTKVRAIFEVKKPPVAKRFEVGNSHVKETFSKLEASSAKRGAQQSSDRAVSRNLVVKDDLVSKNDGRRESKDPSIEETPLSVADRIQALSGVHSVQKSDVSWKSRYPHGADAPAQAHQPSYVKSGEAGHSAVKSGVAGAAQRAAKHKMSTWNVLSGKSIMCEQVKESVATKAFEEHASDINVRETSFEAVKTEIQNSKWSSSCLVALEDKDISIEGLPFLCGSGSLQSDHSTPISTLPTSASSNNVNLSGHATIPSQLSVRANRLSDTRTRLTQPSWLAQRAKVLSCARTRSEIEFPQNEPSSVDGFSTEADIPPRRVEATGERKANQSSGNGKQATICSAEFERQHVPTVERDVARTSTENVFSREAEFESAEAAKVHEMNEPSSNEKQVTIPSLEFKSESVPAVEREVVRIPANFVTPNRTKQSPLRWTRPVHIPLHTAKEDSIRTVVDLGATTLPAGEAERTSETDNISLACAVKHGSFIPNDTGISKDDLIVTLTESPHTFSSRNQEEEKKKAMTKPSWLAQRERILSRARTQNPEADRQHDASSEIGLSRDDEIPPLTFEATAAAKVRELNFPSSNEKQITIPSSEYRRQSAPAVEREVAQIPATATFESRNRTGQSPQRWTRPVHSPLHSAKEESRSTVVDLHATLLPTGGAEHNAETNHISLECAVKHGSFHPNSQGISHDDPIVTLTESPDTISTRKQEKENKETVTKPSWLAQREKILSRARTQNQVAGPQNDPRAGNGLSTEAKVPPRGYEAPGVLETNIPSSNEKQTTIPSAEYKRQSVAAGEREVARIPATFESTTSTRNDLSREAEVPLTCTATEAAEVRKMNVPSSNDQISIPSSIYESESVQAVEQDFLRIPATFESTKRSEQSPLRCRVHTPLDIGNEDSRLADIDLCAMTLPAGEAERTAATDVSLESAVKHELFLPSDTGTSQDDPIVTLMEASEEKKETMPVESILNTRDHISEEAAGFFHVHSSNKHEAMPSFLTSSNHASEPSNVKHGPVVVKPVARKPYVRPVPIKPVVKPVAILPFARTTSDSSTKGPARKAPTGRISEVGMHRVVPGPTCNDNDDSLALPRLVAGILEPFNTDNIMDSSSEGSEFSDGVTLDLSIAEVSNLTNPTALMSRTGGASFDGDQTRSIASEDCEQTSDERSKAKSTDLIDAEAKRSEASSSQTSEAAAPLIAKAMRTFPLSDEVSTDSFFRTRVLIAKQQWKNKSDWERGKADSSRAPLPANVMHEENEKEVEGLEDDEEGIWDIRQVESLFPVKSTSSDEKRFGMVDDWHPFPLEPERTASPKVLVGALRGDEPFVNVTPSRSKTPTRGNTSRNNLRPSSHVLSSTLQHDDPMTRQDSYPRTRLDHRNTGGSMYPRPSAQQLGSEPDLDLSYPRVTVPSRDRPMGYLLPSSGISDRATAAPVLVGNTTYGLKHAELSARIRTLKESRLSRAAAIHNYAAPILSNTKEYDEHSCSTGSSIRFGGSMFFASLAVD